jgi:hypothetical protein
MKHSELEAKREMQTKLSEYACEIGRLKDQLQRKLKPPAAPVKSSIQTVKNLQLS